MNARKVLSLIIVLVAALTFITAPQARGQSAGQIGIFVEDLGTDQKIGAAGGTLTHNWDTLERNDGGAYVYTLGDGVINLAEGHYMVMYNSLFEDDGGQDRSQIESELVLGGSSLATGRSYGYVRRNEGADECVVAGGGIINVVGTQTLSLKSTRTDNNGTNGAVQLMTGSHSAIQLLKLDDSWDYLRLTKTANQAGPTASNDPGAVVVTYQTVPDEIDPSFAYDGSSAITLNTAGHYLVMANTRFNGGGSSTFVQQLTLDGSVVDGSLTTAFMRNKTSEDSASASLGTIIEVTAGQDLNVEVWREYGGGTTMQANETALTIVKLPEGGEYIRLNDSTGALMTTPLTEKTLGWDTSLETDAASFSNADGAITVAQDDDYLFLTTLYDDDATDTRSIYWQKYEVDGGDPLPYGETGRYNRNSDSYNDSAGNWSGALLGLTAGQVVTTTSESLSENTGMISVEEGLQGVRLGSLFVAVSSSGLIWDDTVNNWNSQHWDDGITGLVSAVGGEDMFVYDGTVVVASSVDSGSIPTSPKSLEIDGGTVQIAAGVTLEVNGLVDFIAGTLDLLGSGATLKGKTINLGGTTNVTAGSHIWATSTNALTIASPLDMTAGAGSELTATNAPVEIIDGGALTHGVLYSAASLSVTGSGTATLGSIALSGETVTVDGATAVLDVAGDLNLETGDLSILDGTLTLGAASYVTVGNLTLSNDATHNFTSGKVLAVSGATIVGGDTTTLNLDHALGGTDLTISGTTLSTVDVTVAADSDAVNVSGTVSVGSGGLLIVGGGNIVADTLEVLAGGQLDRDNGTNDGDVTVTNLTLANIATHSFGGEDGELTVTGVVEVRESGTLLDSGSALSVDTVKLVNGGAVSATVTASVDYFLDTANLTNAIGGAANVTVQAGTAGVSGLFDSTGFLAVQGGTASLDTPTGGPHSIGGGINSTGGALTVTSETSTGQLTINGDGALTTSVTLDATLTTTNTIALNGLDISRYDTSGGLETLTFDGAYTDGPFRTFTGVGGVLAETPTDEGEVYAAAVREDTATNNPYPGGDNYAFLWTGNYTAAEDGAHIFRVGKHGAGNQSGSIDDDGSFYVDVNGNGVFEAGEGIATATNGEVSVTLVSGTRYNVAIGFRDGLKGDNFGAWFSRPSDAGAWNEVNPAAVAQEGLWGHTAAATTVENGTLTIGSTGQLGTNALFVGVDGVVTAGGTVDTTEIRIGSGGTYTANAANSAGSGVVEVEGGGMFNLGHDDGLSGTSATVASGGTVQILLGVVPTASPIQIEAYGRLAGDLTGATYGVGGIEFADNAMVNDTLDGGLQPTVAQAGGRNLLIPITATDQDVGSEVGGADNAFKGAYIGSFYPGGAFTGELRAATGVNVDLKLGESTTIDGATFTTDTGTTDIKVMSDNHLLTIGANSLLGTASPDGLQHVNVTGTGENHDALVLSGVAALRDGLSVTILNGVGKPLANNNIEGTIQVGAGGTFELSKTPGNAVNARIDVLAGGVLMADDDSRLEALDPSKWTFGDGAILSLKRSDTDGWNADANEIMAKANLVVNHTNEFPGTGITIGDGKYLMSRWGGDTSLHVDTAALLAAADNATIGFAAFNGKTLKIEEEINGGGRIGVTAVFGSDTEMTTIDTPTDYDRRTEIPSGTVNLDAAINAENVIVKSGVLLTSGDNDGRDLDIVVSVGQLGLDGDWSLNDSTVTVQAGATVSMKVHTTGDVGTLNLNSADGLRFKTDKILDVNTLLTGDGSVRNGDNGLVRMGVASTIEPGDAGVGSLGADRLLLQLGAQYVWEMGLGTGDVINVNGELTLNDTWDLVVTDATGAVEASDEITLFNYGGTLTSGGVVMAGGAITSVNIVPDGSLPAYYNLGGASVVDDGAGRVYVTGIIAFDDVSWDGLGSGNWATDLSWTTDAQPGFNSKVTIDEAATSSTVTVNTAVADIWRLRVGETNTSGLAVVDSGVLSVSGSAIIGDNGSLTVSGTGVFNSDTVDTAGTTTLSGTGAGQIGTMNSTGTTSLGGASNIGVLNATAGTTTLAGASFGDINASTTTDITADTTASGDATFSGTVNAASDLAAAGALTIDGSTLNVTDVADFATGTGVTVVKNTPDLNIGATGHLTIQAAGGITLPEGTLGFWSFDEGNANDLSGNDHHGTPYGPVAYTTPGETAFGSGSAVDLTGGDAAIFVDTGGNQDVFSGYDSMTIAVWAKGIAGGPDGGGPGRWSPFVCKDEDGWQMRRHEEDAELDWTTRGLTSSDWTVPNSGPATNGDWHFIVMTYDGSQKKAYIYGADLGAPIIESIGATGTINNTSDMLVFGARDDDNAAGTVGWEKFLNGYLDDILFVDRALDQAEIEALYANAGGGGAFGDLVMDTGSELTLVGAGDAAGEGSASFDSITGNGTINGEVTIAGGASPGASAGTIVVNGDLIVGGSSVNTWEDGDLIDVNAGELSGNVTLEDGLTVDIAETGAPAAGTAYDLVQFEGALTVGDAAVGSFGLLTGANFTNSGGNAGWDGANAYYDADSVFLLVSATHTWNGADPADWTSSNWDAGSAPTQLADMIVNGGTVDVAAPHIEADGAMSLTMGGGAVNVNAALDVADTVTIDAGTLTVNDTLNVDNSVDVNGGALAVGATGSLNVATSIDVTASGGLTTASGGSVTAPALTSSGTVDIDSFFDVSVVDLSGATSIGVNTTGTIGTMNVTGDTTTINGAGNTINTLNVETGGAVIASVDPTSVGALNVTGGTVTTTDATVDDIAVSADGTLTATGAVSTTGGVSIDSSTLNAGGNISTTGAFKLNDATLNADGTVVVTAGSIRYLQTPDLNVDGSLTLPTLAQGGIAAPGTIEGHYSFDTDYTDDSGVTVRDSVAVGGAVIDAANSIVGAGSMLMDGVDSGMDTLTHYNDAFSTKTVAFWIKQAPADKAGAQALWEEGGTSKGLGLYIEDGVLGGGISNDAGGAVEAAVTDSTTTDLADNEWHHVAMSYGDTAQWLRLYVDGVEVGSADSGVATVGSHSGDGNFGIVDAFPLNDNGFTTTYYKGWADDLYIYANALSAEDIALMASNTTTFGDVTLTGASTLIMSGDAAATFTTITGDTGASITGAVTLTGTITPAGGNGGALTITDSLIMGDGSTYDWQTANGSSVDTVVTGTLDITEMSNISLNVSGAVDLANNPFTLFTYTTLVGKNVSGDINDNFTLVAPGGPYSDLINLASSSLTDTGTAITMTLVGTSSTVWSDNAADPGVSDVWSTPGNWNSGAPSLTVAAVIDSSAQSVPTVSATDAKAHTLIIDNASAIIDGSGILQVANNTHVMDGSTLTVDGTLNSDGDTIVYDGGTASFNAGSTLASTTGNLNVTGGTATLDNAMTSIAVNAINVTGGTLNAEADLLTGGSLLSVDGGTVASTALDAAAVNMTSGSITSDGAATATDVTVTGGTVVAGGLTTVSSLDISGGSVTSVGVSASGNVKLSGLGGLSTDANVTGGTVELLGGAVTKTGVGSATLATTGNLDIDTARGTDIRVDGGTLVVNLAAAPVASVDPVHVLLVTDGDTAATAGELAVKARLEARGFTVEAHNQSQDPPVDFDVANYQLVITTYDILNDSVGKFGQSNVPLLSASWDGYNADQLGWAASSGRVSPDGTTIDMVSTVHNPAGGRLSGTENIYAAPGDIGWANGLTPDAEVIAEVDGVPVMFTYDTGDALLDIPAVDPDPATPRFALARQVGMWWENDLDDATPEGLELFDAGVNYALGRENEIAPWLGAVTLQDTTQLTIAGAGAAADLRSITLEGTGTGTVASTNGVSVFRGLAPGVDVAGEIAITGPLTVEAAVKYTWDTTDDVVSIDGAVTLDDGWTLVLEEDGTAPAVATYYTLFDYTGALGASLTGVVLTDVNIDDSAVDGTELELEPGVFEPDWAVDSSWLVVQDTAATVSLYIAQTLDWDHVNQADGNYETDPNWLLGVTPTQSMADLANVTIGGGNVTIDTDRTGVKAALAIEVSNGASLTVDGGSGGALDVARSITLVGTVATGAALDIDAATVNIGIDLDVGADTVATIQNGSVVTLGDDLISDGAMTVTGSTINVGDDMRAEITGSISITGTSVVTVADEVSVDAGSSLTVSGGAALNALTLDTVGTTDMTGGVGTIGTVTVTGGDTTLTSTAITQLNATGGTVSAEGDIDNLSVSGATTIVNTTAAIAGMTNVQQSDGAVTLGGDLETTTATLNGGTMDASAGDLIINNQVRIGGFNAEVTAGPAVAVSGADLRAERTMTLASGSTVLIHTSAIPQEASLDGFWTFDEADGTVVGDLSANGRDGTMVGFVGDGSERVVGVSGNALDFDGASNRVNIVGYDGVTGTQARTTAAWIKTTDTDGGVLAWGYNDDGEKWGFRTNNDNIRTEVNGGNIVGTAVVTDDAWHHVVMVLDADADPNVNEMVIYVDGVLDPPSGSSGEPIDTRAGTDVYIGSNHDNDYFEGLMDEVGIWRRALTADEITTLYNGGAGLDQNAQGAVNQPETNVVFSGTSTLSMDTSAAARLGDVTVAAGQTATISGPADLTFTNMTLGVGSMVRMTEATTGGVATVTVGSGGGTLNGGNGGSASLGDAADIGVGGFTNLALTADATYEHTFSAAGGEGDQFVFVYGELAMADGATIRLLGDGFSYGYDDVVLVQAYGFDAALNVAAINIENPNAWTLGALEADVGSGQLRISVDTVLPGDANNDGFVDDADYDIFKDQFGRAPTTIDFAARENADFDRNNRVDLRDLAILDAAWGADGGPSAPELPGSNETPEPATMSLLALGGLLILRRRRRKA